MLSEMLDQCYLHVKYYYLGCGLLLFWMWIVLSWMLEYGYLGCWIIAILDAGILLSWMLEYYCLGCWNIAILDVGLTILDADYCYRGCKLLLTWM